MASPTTFSKTQIYLHWLVAALVIFQFVLNEGIVKLWSQRMDGIIPNAPSINPHAVVGMLILVLVLWRLVLRFTRGVPVAPENENSLLKLAAKASHFLFYALLLAMPLSGAGAWFLGLEQPALVHTTAKFVLLPLIGLHIAAALAHHFWFKTNVFRRMLGMK